MPLVFVNYRNNDEEATATLLDQHLSKRFGSNAVFRASKSIQPGDDYRERLLNAVRRSEVLLAVIGSRWLDATAERGGRKLDDPHDWVRQEILEALAYQVRVIPVLVGDVRPLSPASLPQPLEPLAHCQYLRFSHRNADADLARVAEEVAKVTGNAAQAQWDSRSHGDQVNSTVRDVHQGNVVQGRDRFTHNPGGVGDVVGGAGTVIGTAYGPLHTGSGAQYNAPQFHGDAVNYVAGDNHGSQHQRHGSVPREDDS
ncbi:hypothetical protein JCM3263A_11900 [Thermobifida fusca]|jgi:hypothetical protein|uniref:TIR domain-containing protein n=2 Tax=Thermobifida fusca TaxID=2021 RepID=A0A9P2TBU7_THEFU|nr:toll/interleukin-1 receptor domain-containing protein [Thermobifida fusca]AAZ54766.1 hypothetical protein Tfu_0728 [Thermobifida fusca YX]EOR72277.1 hypothetical protein TM51_03997 [Thermobifida fusca TM51]MDD6793134.1 toll/interleukin-1 receptor domain-containing protein [Thermobifida fusca]PZN64521.1 MAG: TIR domain-containing protein [Thermobifida fusca]QOS60283.1 toll/interleukin-1 receptor domain-containing protein [Thermobifida fusca]